jgi:hypothetical protein
MGIGILILAFNTNHNHINIKPDITYFKKVFIKYINFYIDHVQQNFISHANFGERASCIVNKLGDLLGNIMLVVKLPNVHKNDASKVGYMKWDANIEHHIVKSAIIDINNVIVDKYYGDYAHVHNTCNITHSIKTLNNINTQWQPHVEELTLYIPILFNLSAPLPLCVISDAVRISIEFENIEKCCKTAPTHYVTVSDDIVLFTQFEYIYSGNKYGQFIYFDNVTRTLYYNKLIGSFATADVIYTTNDTYSVTTTIAEQTYTPPYDTDDIAIADSYLINDYYFMEDIEVTKLKSKELTYIIHTVSTSNSHTSNGNQLVKIDTHSPITRIYWKYSFDGIDDYIFNNILTKYNDVFTNVQLYIDGNIFNIIDDINFSSYVEPFYNKVLVSNNMGVMCFNLLGNDSQPSGIINLEHTRDAKLLFITKKPNTVLDNGSVILKNIVFVKQYRYLTINNDKITIV